MKKIILTLSALIIVSGCSNCFADEVQPSAKEEIKAAASLTVDATKTAAQKTAKATKKASKKTVEVSKNIKNKTVSGTKKAVKETKEFTNKAVENTKDAFANTKENIESLNPNKPVTFEELQTKATVNTLKDEKKQLKDAYNSRLKDIKAKMVIAQNSTTISDVEKRDTIYNLEKQMESIKAEKDAAIKKYNEQIKAARFKK